MVRAVDRRLLARDRQVLDTADTGETFAIFETDQAHALGIAANNEISATGVRTSVPVELISMIS